MEGIKVIPLASDSMGTRSMATFVDTRSAKILIDPGVALGPSRYGLPPHRLEIEKLAEDWERIKKFTAKADIIIVTHYHYDHHDPEEPEIYEGKVVLLKHPTEKINQSQKRRASFFIEKLEGMPEKIEYPDGRNFSFGSTEVKFSSPVFHGTNSKLGYVVEVSVREKRQCFLHTSDVEGPSLSDQVEFILQEKPDVVYADGPMTYMLGYRYSAKSFEASVKNMIDVIENTSVKKVILDHHLLRDIRWNERIKGVFDAAKERGVEILTAAEFLGMENCLLEAKRKELFASKV